MVTRCLGVLSGWHSGARVGLSDRMPTGPLQNTSSATCTTGGSGGGGVQKA